MKKVKAIRNVCYMMDDDDNRTFRVEALVEFDNRESKLVDIQGTSNLLNEDNGLHDLSLKFAEKILNSIK